ncbi:hypothetical protein ACOMHN_012097 [Nucella lapillus]
MHRLNEKDSVLAKKIDKDAGVRNSWNFSWLQGTVELKWREKEKEKSVEVKLGDTISKINEAGKAVCSLCEDVIRYGSNGKKALTLHVTTAKHVTKVKDQLTNQSVGSFGSTTQGEEHPVFTVATPSAASETNGLSCGEKPASGPVVPVNDRVCNQETKLPINNAVLKAMSVFSPEYKHNSCEAQTRLKSLPDLVNNVLKPLEANEEDEDKIRDAYTAQVLDFCNCLDKPSPRKPNGDAVPVDEWWGAVNQNGEYDLLYKLVTALLTCFHGPRVESSFSIMSEVLDAKANRMAVSTFSAIQTVKYALQSSGQSAVACFYRKDKLYTPVNKKLCQLMRGAWKKHKEEQAAQREIEEAKRTALSLQKQKLVSKQQAKLKLAEAEKAARIAHRRAMRAKLEELSLKKKKAGAAASTLNTNCQRSSSKSQSSDSSFKLSSQKADSVRPPSAKRQVSGSMGRSRGDSHASKAKSQTTAGSTKMHTPAPAPATPSTSGNAAHLSAAKVQSSVPLHQLSREELFKTLSLKMGQAQTFEELVQICEEYKWCLQKWDVAIASDLDAADYQKDTMACDLYRQMVLPCAPSRFTEMDDLSEDIFQLTTRQLLALVDFIVLEAAHNQHHTSTKLTATATPDPTAHGSATANQSTAGREGGGEEEGKGVGSRVELLLACVCERDDRIQSIVSHIQRRAPLVTRVEEDCYIELVTELYLHFPYILTWLPEAVSTNVIASHRLHSKLDTVTHRLISVLGKAGPSKLSESRMKDANMACRKLASRHPTLILRQLPLLAAVVGGRTQLSIGEMRHRNLLLLFVHVMGLLELLQPHVFHRQHTSLAAVLQAFFSLFRAHGKEKRSLGSLVYKMVVFLQNFVTYDPQPASTLLQQYVQLLSDLSLVYPDMAELKSLLTGLTLPRQNQNDATADTEGAGTGESAEPGSVTLPSQGGGLPYAQVLVVLKRLRSDTPIDDLVVALREVDETSKRRVVILEHFGNELMGLMTHVNEQCRSTSFALIMRYIHHCPRKAEQFLPSFLNCLQHHNPDVVTSALKNLAEFTVLCQDEAPILLQKAFDVGVSTTLNTAPYVSETLQLLNMESILYAKQPAGPAS